MAHQPQPHGARSVYGAKPPGKRRPLLLALLALLLIGLLIAGLVLAANDDDKQASKPKTTATQAQDEATGGTAAPGGGELTVAGTSILPPPGSLEEYIGQDATGTKVEVVKVEGQQGFWVGTSMDERVYVEYGAKAGVAEEGAAFKPKVGDTVDLTAEVRPSPEQPGRTLKIPASEEDIIKRQGAFLNAKDVRLAG